MQYCQNTLIVSPYKAQVALAAQKWEETYPGMETKPRIRGGHRNRHAHEQQRISGLPDLVRSHQHHNIQGKTLRRGHRKLGLGIWTGQPLNSGK
ncbi:hypothetical protein BDV38DRAFT_252654 [Aspergillus pseudotamarii]|uniref:Uncharacterized protein n=1 Tax=Aspergillus pseudotamarii TaxID=132259 RepID=A0A5N6SN78_ASPPS|nr:uncharacterized protein BDV38DRAFT_252654 [Aspergillus pseudotamarii]KAE8135357.1 hypothetical protein BDV38DRAFT_252654 [Aspergillus pseudotamarii]